MSSDFSTIFKSRFDECPILSYNITSNKKKMTKDLFGGSITMNKTNDINFNFFSLYANQEIPDNFEFYISATNGFTDVKFKQVTLKRITKPQVIPKPVEVEPPPINITQPAPPDIISNTEEKTFTIYI